MATLQMYNINAMATQISREFFIVDDRENDKSYILQEEMLMFAQDRKERVTFISRVKDL